MTQKNSLRILVITSTYPRNEDDYAVPWMRETHRRLASQGHEVTVLAPSYKGLASHKIDGINVVRFRYAPKRLETLTHEEGAPYRVRQAWRQLLAIPYVLIGCLVAGWLGLTRRYDVVHVHWAFPHGIMGQVAARINRAPLVIMSHGAAFALAKRKRWIRPFLRQSLRAADLRLANSTDTARHVEEISSQDCVVLPYGTTVTPCPVPDCSGESPRVLFTGRLIERKGIEYLLHAARLVLQRHDVRFIITGNGDQRERLENLQRELGLENDVEFVGFLTKQQLQQEYARCAMWVNPAIVDSWGDAEGLGVGSIEAYNYRKPVIASAVGGIPDTVVDGYTGYLVPEKDAVQLASRISELLSNPEKAKWFGRNGFRFSQKTFAWEQIIPRMEALYALVGLPFQKGGLSKQYS